ncbi:MAG: ATP-binding protein [Anaerolineae bacterium]|nr:ATP-binding protein [Anaerolineae bacterium]
MADSELEAVKDFRAELRISPVPAIIILFSITVLVFTVSGIPTALDERVQLMMLAGAILLMSVSSLYLYRWRTWAGRWFSVCALIVIFHLSSRWMGTQGALLLGVLPVALAGALISVPAAAAAALLQTIIIHINPIYRTLGSPFLWSAVMTLWGTAGIIYGIYHPVQRVASWAWAYFQKAQYLLEEARDRRMELEQAIDDLADANQQLTHLNMLAQGLRQEAEDARTAKAQFVANVSHELRTPLNMITGFSEMILQSPETYGGNLPPSLLADLSVIERNAEHLGDLINDVLDLSQIEADQMALTKEYVDFAEIVSMATLAVRPLYESKGLYLKVEVQDDLPEVYCDRTRIREVILNLLSNAGRFTEKGGVDLRVYMEMNDLLVSVVDTGRGIAAGDLSKLFQPFQQIDGTIRRRYGGTGLGLNISKRFIELHGGRIWVESQAGSGTIFTFRIPIQPMVPMTSDFSRWLTPEWEFLQRTRPLTKIQGKIKTRYVVLDQGRVLQGLLNRYMAEVEVISIDGLPDALTALEKSPVQALLINTVSISHMLEELRRSSLPPGTPVMLFSIPSTLDASAALGVEERLVKPVARDDLLDTFERLGVTSGTVLIVDDEPDALQLFGRMLTSSERDYRVLLARDGQEALSILREYHPDIMLLDLVMPNMDGFELLEQQAQHVEWHDIPVVVASALDPAGQPILSPAVAVTLGGGISTRQLMQFMQTVSHILSAVGQVAGREPREKTDA